MQLSNAQKRLIREICKIQNETLTDILISPELGTNDWGEKWEHIMKDLEVSREQFDDEVIISTQVYQGIDKDPNTLFEALDEIDFKVFEYILELFDDQLKDIYPKAYENLLVKVALWKDLIENRKS